MSRSLLAFSACAVALVACAGPALASQHKPDSHPAAAKAPQSDEELIRSAMRAAPAKVAAGAAVVAAKPDGSLRTVRAGTNGFSCMADNPTTPGPDPMCMDASALTWAGAWMGHKPPPTGKVGLMYMLSGGTDASNTDPYATKPDATNHWVETGPHVMVVGADPAFYAQYPKSPTPDTAVPYVMWAGTPYEHLMIPIK